MSISKKRVLFPLRVGKGSLGLFNLTCGVARGPIGRVSMVLLGSGVSCSVNGTILHPKQSKKNALPSRKKDPEYVSTLEIWPMRA